MRNSKEYRQSAVVDSICVVIGLTFLLATYYGSNLIPGDPIWRVLICVLFWLSLAWIAISFICLYCDIWLYRSAKKSEVTQ